MISINLIKFAFEEDNDINKYCDPNYKNKSIKKIIVSIYKKLLEYENIGDSKFDKIVFDNEIIGYVFYFKNLLISFGINKNHRTKEKLSSAFEQIKNNFNGDFESYMWERNERAINWLKKCGMVEVPCKIKEAKRLKYILCH